MVGPNNQNKTYDDHYAEEILHSGQFVAEHHVGEDESDKSLRTGRARTTKHKMEGQYEHEKRKAMKNTDKKKVRWKRKQVLEKTQTVQEG